MWSLFAAPADRTGRHVRIPGVSANDLDWLRAEAIKVAAEVGVIVPPRFPRSP